MNEREQREADTERMIRAMAPVEQWSPPRVSTRKATLAGGLAILDSLTPSQFSAMASHSLKTEAYLVEGAHGTVAIVRARDGATAMGFTRHEAMQNARRRFQS